MSSPAHGEATDGQTEKFTVAMGQACCTHTHTHTPTGTETAACPSAGKGTQLPAFLRTRSRKFCTPNSHNRAVLSEGDPITSYKGTNTASQWEPGASPSWRKFLAVHPLGNLVRGTTSQVSGSSPVEQEDWTCTSQLALRTKDHAHMAFRA